MSIYEFSHLQNNNHHIVGEIIAKYQINLCHVALDYGIDSDEREIFNEWVCQARDCHPDGWVSIDWYVHVKNKGFKPERMPGQWCEHGNEDFLTYFTHPVNIETGKLLDWKTVPVDGGVKGANFIENLTGWTPELLQTKVSIEWLIEKVNQTM